MDTIQGHRGGSRHHARAFPNGHHLRSTRFLAHSNGKPHGRPHGFWLFYFESTDLPLVALSWSLLQGARPWKSLYSCITYLNYIMKTLNCLISAFGNSSGALCVRPLWVQQEYISSTSGVRQEFGNSSGAFCVQALWIQQEFEVHPSPWSQTQRQSEKVNRDGPRSIFDQHHQKTWPRPSTRQWQWPCP